MQVLSQKMCSGDLLSIPQKVQSGEGTSFILKRFELVNKILCKILNWKILVFESIVAIGKGFYNGFPVQVLIGKQFSEF